MQVGVVTDVLALLVCLGGTLGILIAPPGLYANPMVQFYVGTTSTVLPPSTDFTSPISPDSRVCVYAGFLGCFAALLQGGQALCMVAGHAIVNSKLCYPMMA